MGVDIGSKKIAAKIKKLPDSPGVYKFFNAKKRIIYVGKAKRLRRRVRSYFRRGHALDDRLKLMVREVRDIKFISTSSEAEALIYEAGLIKDHSPRFNIDLRDDKSYPFLKLTVNEKYPRLFLTRRRLNDGAIYYGPYVNVKLLKSALSFMKRVFPLRTCRRLLKSRCLEYHIEQCAGPCEGKVSVREYNDIVSHLKKFLDGRKEDLMISLERQMKRFSGEYEYEKALIVKKRIEALTAIKQLHDSAQRPIYGELDELQSVLRLDLLPVIIECFDVSNIGGKQAVGAMVRFVAGRSRKSDYRKFRVKNVEGIDDYSMIREVVNRRYSRVIAERGTLPDLILIDGGRGHLSAAAGELKKLGLAEVAVASIAKEHNHLYCSTRSQPMRLSPGSRLLFLVQRVRDEAHRFAVTYHRSLRRKEKFDTELRKINSIGPARENLLMKKFGSSSNIAKATQKELVEAGLNLRTAKEIIKYFKKYGNASSSTR